MTTEKTVVVGVSDLHINSRVALSTPNVSLDDGGTYRASRGQRWLWECWLDFWQRIGQVYDDWTKIVIFNGDMGELDLKRRSYQLITPNKADIISMAIDTIMPAIDIADRVYVIRGTPAHEGKSAWLEEIIARDIDNAVKQSKKVASWYQVRGKIGKKSFDIAHHVSMGGLPWNKGNAAMRLASRTDWAYQVKMKQPSPTFTLRSHNHTWADSGQNFDTYAICLPGWSLATEFAYRIGKENELADIGGLVIEIENGHWTERRHKYDPPESKRVWARNL